MFAYKDLRLLQLKCLAFLSITSIAACQLEAALHLLPSVLQILGSSTKEFQIANLYNFNLLEILLGCESDVDENGGTCSTMREIRNKCRISIKKF